MRALLRSLAGLVSIAALAKLLARRRPTSAPDLLAPSEDPADELRRKLEQVRQRAPGPIESTEPPADALHQSALATAAEPSPDAPATSSDSIDGTPQSPSIEERRASVHARAQEAIDAMKGIDS